MELSNGTVQSPLSTGIESLCPLYLDPEFSKSIGRITQQKCFRVEIGAGRHYRNEAGQTFKSITTFLDAVMPPNKFLQKWRESKIEELGSVEKTYEFVQATADFGTALHIAVADYCRNGLVDWAQFEEFSVAYFIGMGLKDHTLYAAHEELTKDFASMMAFIHEYEVRILAVEIPVFSSDGYATLVDLVVEMNALKYTEKTEKEKRQRIVAGINLKSGKKGFFETHLFQLIGERRAFNETYGKASGIELVEVFNLAPTDWRTEPTYKIARQTKPIEEQGLDAQFDLFVQIGKSRGILGKPTKNFTIFEGETMFGESPVQNLRTFTYDEFAQRRLSAMA